MSRSVAPLIDTAVTRYSSVCAASTASGPVAEAADDAAGVTVTVKSEGSGTDVRSRVRSKVRVTSRPSALGSSANGGSLGGAGPPPPPGGGGGGGADEFTRWSAFAGTAGDLRSASVVVPAALIAPPDPVLNASAGKPTPDRETSPSATV